MSTAIQWTDETWNAITGCKQVSPGCAHCYAKVEHDRRHKAHQAGKRVAPQYAEPFEVVQLHPDRLDAPLRRRKPTRYFVTSGADPFHEDVPDDYIDRMFAVMAAATHHTFQLLTKRPARMREYVSAPGLRERIGWVATAAMRSMKGGQAKAFQNGPFTWRECEPWCAGPWKYRLSGVAEDSWPLPNVWLGVSVENQRFADERIPLLVQTPAAVRFLSCEPLLGHLEFDFDDIAWRDAEGRYLDWVIVGGESGAGARRCDVFDITDVVAQCELSGVACFVKQLGACPVIANDSDAGLWPGASIPFAEKYEPHHQGELGPLKLRHRHGADMAEWPTELRVREFPASGVRA